jgi:hypothetical protein
VSVAKLMLDVDKDGGFQMSIGMEYADGSGSGYRLYGPKYVGRSTSLFRVTLTAAERKKIREYLDQADELGLP